jgi:hypothetical protein
MHKNYNNLDSSRFRQRRYQEARLYTRKLAVETNTPLARPSTDM